MSINKRLVLTLAIVSSFFAHAARAEQQSRERPSYLNRLNVTSAVAAGGGTRHLWRTYVRPGKLYDVQAKLGALEHASSLMTEAEFGAAVAKLDAKFNRSTPASGSGFSAGLNDHLDDARRLDRLFAQEAALHSRDVVANEAIRDARIAKAAEALKSYGGRNKAEALLRRMKFRGKVAGAVTVLGYMTLLGGLQATHEGIRLHDHDARSSSRRLLIKDDLQAPAPVSTGQPVQGSMGSIGN